MYGGIGFRRGVLGDVDVLHHEGLFHLFHLVLPNHSYIAHAVSTDGLTWEAAPHAMYISDPGEFDDDMLWTMHVSKDPHKPGSWRMFYTGLSRAEQGRVQRVGLARSDDLYTWTKATGEPGLPYPLGPHDEPYESELLPKRRWRSYRDPYFFKDGDEHLLLACGRVNSGSIIRRGCVVTAKEVEPDRFEFIKPLHHPGIYDEIEVPALCKIAGRYFLLGSLREDTKVRYWFSENLYGPYHNYFDNVLLPQGNYAARPSKIDDEWVVWCFYTKWLGSERLNFLLPPKVLSMDNQGRLRKKSYAGFNQRVTRTLEDSDLRPFTLLRGNPYAETPPSLARRKTDQGWLGAGSGFEAFLLPGQYRDFRLRAEIQSDGPGKCGLVFRSDDEGNGYYLSLDLVKGLAQLRRWGEADIQNPDDPPEVGFDFTPLQSSHFLQKPDPHWRLELLTFGSYIEFSLNGFIVLTLADEGFQRGRLGFYVEGARLRVERTELAILRGPGDPDSDLPAGLATEKPV